MLLMVNCGGYAGFGIWKTIYNHSANVKIKRRWYIPHWNYGKKMDTNCKLGWAIMVVALPNYRWIFNNG